MNTETWLNQFTQAYTAAGKPFSESTRRTLLSPLPDSRTAEQIQTVAEAKEVMTTFFFQKALKGAVFGDVARIRERFGRTLEENYGRDSGPFLALARTFWTFKVEVSDLHPEATRLFLTQALLLVEREISSVFFPTPGPSMIPVDQRRDAQIAIMGQYAPGFDIDRFLAENPILQLEKERQSSGCFGLFLLLCAFGATLSVFLW